MNIKYFHELSYWNERYKAEGNRFNNSWYKEIMLAMAEESDDSFMKNKIVADFGCGPRGSLFWSDLPSLRIGIDVLVDSYIDIFEDSIKNHRMIYIKCTEKHIPIPSETIDILYTMNSMDHVENFPDMSLEVLRVLKKNGKFMGSFNINEKKTICEPSPLNYDIIEKNIISKLNIDSIRVTTPGQNSTYENFLIKPMPYPANNNDKAIMWICGTKK